MVVAEKSARRSLPASGDAHRHGRRSCMPDALSTPAVDTRTKYQRLMDMARQEPAIRTAVVHPCDDVSLQSAVEARRLGLIEPILVGPAERIRRVADKDGFDIDGMEIVNALHSHDSAAKAVQLVRAGRAEALMKGSLHTDELMGAVVAPDSGLRT